MSSKDLKHMGREELLQWLIQLTKENDDLKMQLQQKEQEMNQLKEHHAAASPIDVQEAGSIAQAALQMNHVFEDAQKAADQYLSTIARMQREQALRCQKLLAEAQAEADRRITEAQQRAHAIESESARQCQELRKMAEQAAQHNWDDLSRRLDQLCQSNTELRNMLTSDNKKRNFHR